MRSQTLMVGGGKDGRELVLRGRGLVVLGLGQDAQLPQLVVQLLHERLDARLADGKLSGSVKEEYKN